MSFTIIEGEPLNMQLNITSGDPGLVTSIVAKIKKAGPNKTVPSEEAPIVATFSTSYRNQEPFGWDLAISPEITNELGRGVYVASATLNLTSGGPLKTTPVFIEIKPSVL